MGSGTGDLVWAHVHGYPWWPGQVMDPAKATEKAKKKAQPGKVLISFFGDNSFGWFAQGELVSFISDYADKKAQPHQTKTFIRAVEEAKEVHDRRQGLKPATSHDPWDFLSPDAADDSEHDSDEDQPASRRGRKSDLRPAEAQQQHAQKCTAQQAVQWLHMLAQGRSVDKWSAEQAEAANLLAFAALKSRATPMKKKRGRRSKQAAMQEERSPTKAERPAASPRGRKKKAAHKAGDAVESVNVLPDSYEGFNEALPQQQQPTLLLAEAADQESEAMAEPDAESKGGQTAVIEGEDESKLQTSAADAPVSVKAELPEAKPEVSAREEKRIQEELLNPVALPSFTPTTLLKLLHLLARDPYHLGQESYGTLGVCALRWRESAFCRSDIHRKQLLGRMLMRALQCPDVRAKAEEQKEDDSGEAEMGEEAELQGLLNARRKRKMPEADDDEEYAPKRRRKSYTGGVQIEEPVIESEARQYTYRDRIPGTAAEFTDALNAFYEQHGAPANPTVTVNHSPLDMHALFLAVADQGGYNAVTLQRNWSHLGGALNDKWATASTILRKHYVRYLLAYEQTLTDEAPYTLVSNVYGKRKKSTGSAASAPRASLGDSGGVKRERDESAIAGKAAKVKKDHGVKRKATHSGYAGDRDEPKGRLTVSKPQPVKAQRMELREASLSNGDDSGLDDSGGEDSEDAPHQSRQQHPSARNPSIHNPRRPAVGPPQAVGASRVAQRPKPEPGFEKPYPPLAGDSRTLQKFDSMMQSPSAAAPAAKSEAKLTQPVTKQESRHPPWPEEAAEKLAPTANRKVVKDTLLMRFPQDYRVPTKAQVLIRLRKFNVIENDDHALRVNEKSRHVVARFPNERCARQAEASAKSNADAWFSMPQGSIRVMLEVFKPPLPRAAADKANPQPKPSAVPARPAPSNRPAARTVFVSANKPPVRSVLTNQTGPVMHPSQPQQPQQKLPQDPRKLPVAPPADPRRARASAHAPIRPPGGLGMQAGQQGAAASQLPAASSANQHAPAPSPPATSAGIDLLSILRNAGIAPSAQQAQQQAQRASQQAQQPQQQPQQQTQPSSSNQTAPAATTQGSMFSAWQPPPPRPPPSSGANASGGLNIEGLDIGGQLLGLLGQLQQ